MVNGEGVEEGRSGAGGCARCLRVFLGSCALFSRVRGAAVVATLLPFHSRSFTLSPLALPAVPPERCLRRSEKVARRSLSMTMSTGTPLSPFRPSNAPTKDHFAPLSFHSSRELTRVSEQGQQGETLPSWHPRRIRRRGRRLCPDRFDAQKG